MDQGTLEDIQRLLDIEAIKQLKARYCKYADSGEHPDEFADLFLAHHYRVQKSSVQIDIICHAILQELPP